MLKNNKWIFFTNKEVALKCWENVVRNIKNLQKGVAIFSKTNVLSSSM